MLYFCWNHKYYCNIITCNGHIQATSHPALTIFRTPQWVPTRVKQLSVAFPPYVGRMREPITGGHQITMTSVSQPPNVPILMYQAGKCNFQWWQFIVYLLTVAILASAVAYCKQLYFRFYHWYVTCACVGTRHLQLVLVACLLPECVTSLLYFTGGDFSYVISLKCSARCCMLYS